MKVARNSEVSNQTAYLEESVYLLSGLRDLVVPFLEAVCAIIQVEQSLVLTLLPLEQRTVAPSRHDLLDLLHVVLRVLHSFLQIVNFVSVKLGKVTSKIFTCSLQCCILTASYTYALFTFTDADSEPDSDLISVHGSSDGNLNLTLCSVKSSVHYNAV